MIFLIMLEFTWIVLRLSTFFLKLKVWEYGLLMQETHVYGGVDY